MDGRWCRRPSIAPAEALLTSTSVLVGSHLIFPCPPKQVVLRFANADFRYPVRDHRLVGHLKNRSTSSPIMIPSKAVTRSWIRAWTGNPSLTAEEYRVFGQDGTGGYAAFWCVRPGAPILQQPIVFSVTEGAVGVLASHFADYLWLLAGGFGPFEALSYSESERLPNQQFSAFARLNSGESQKSCSEFYRTRVPNSQILRRKYARCVVDHDWKLPARHSQSSSCMSLANVFANPFLCVYRTICNSGKTASDCLRELIRSGRYLTRRRSDIRFAWFLARCTCDR
jgi:hypothetical protein